MADLSKKIERLVRKYPQKSMAEITNMLSDTERSILFDGFSEEEMEELLFDGDFWLRPKQKFDDTDEDWYITAFVGGRGAGKEACVYTPVPTLDGWKNLGDIQVGDRLFDENGKPCTVTHAHPVHIPEKAYELYFSDGSSIKCNSEHLWTTWTQAARKAYNRSKRKEGHLPNDWPTWTNRNRWGHDLGGGPKTITTEELVNTFRYGKRGDLNHSIPVTAPLQYEEKDLPIDPWTYGAFLGDGTRKNGTLSSHKDESLWMIQEFEDRGYPLVSARPQFKSVDGETVVTNCIILTFKGFVTELRKSGTLFTKDILDIYRYGSIQQRKDVLAGLLDTDGYIGGRGLVEFVSKRKDHAEFVLYLARSLGQKPTLNEGRATLNGKDYGTKYRVTWRPTYNPFYMPRKRAMYKEPNAQGSRSMHRMIVDFKEIDPIPMRCLEVDSPNHLFLIGEAMIPTHNSLAGAHWVKKKALENPGCRIFVAGRTAADIRNTMVLGASGILSVHSEADKPEYKMHMSSLHWPNGSEALLLSSESPDSARGPQAHFTLGDEFAAWKTTPDSSGATLYDNLIAATRLGKNPQIVLTTTPKKTKVMRDIMKRAEDPVNKIRLVKGSTLENSSLPQSYIDNLLRQYGDSPLAKQEIEGVMLDDAEGIVFTQDLISSAKTGGDVPNNLAKIIAVDPSVSADPEKADECGIMVLGSTRESDPGRRTIYLLEDVTVRATPEVWIQVIVETAKRHGVRDVVAERNQGGALIRTSIQAADADLRVHDVWATKGKVKRTEPVVIAMHQGRVRFVEDFPTLEDQMIYYDPEDSKYSPDRMDAFVWGVTALGIDPPKSLSLGLMHGRQVQGIVPVEIHKSIKRMTIPRRRRT